MDCRKPLGSICFEVPSGRRDLQYVPSAGRDEHALCHSRAGGSPLHLAWIPACAGMTNHEDDRLSAACWWPINPSSSASLAVSSIND